MALCLLALLGHAAVWAEVFNRLHARAVPRRRRELAEKLILAAFLAVPALAVAGLTVEPLALQRPLEAVHRHWAAAAYFWFCAAAAVRAIAGWLRQRVRGRPPQLVSNHGQVLDVRRQLGRLPCADRGTRFWARVPGNQVLQLEVNQKTLCLPQLPAELDGLRIAHLSDLHFTGRFTRDFFELIVRQSNQLQPDLVAITGDIIDRPQCLPWFETLAGLESRLGVYCILGNHEHRVGDKALVVDGLTAAGLHYLGGSCAVVTHRGRSILLAGNELPWWGPAPDIARCEADHAQEHALRLLLSHSPDQIHWARRHGFDLMLAGHTHGGQIRPPGIGPIITQSRYGARYATGLIAAPPTLLHVSRGLSGCQPLRINCRPELTLLVLNCQGEVA